MQLDYALNDTNECSQPLKLALGSFQISKHVRGGAKSSGDCVVARTNRLVTLSPVNRKRQYCQFSGRGLAMGIL